MAENETNLEWWERTDPNGLDGPRPTPYTLDDLFLPATPPVPPAAAAVPPPITMEEAAERAATGLPDRPPDLRYVPQLRPVADDPPLPPRDEWTQWGDPPTPGGLDDIGLPPDCVPPGSFIDQYIGWASSATDAAPAFHWLAAVSLLAISMERWSIAHGHTRLSPRTYGLIVGGSGSRKSEVLRLARSVLKGTLVNDAQFGSEQAFLEGLQEAPRQLWLLYEGGSVFRQLGEKFHRSMAQKLCQLYDGDPVVTASKASGRVEVDTHYLCLLTGSTEVGLVPSGDARTPLRELVQTGLMGRVWICASGRKVVEYDDPRKPDERVQSWLRDFLAQLRLYSQPVEVRMSPEAYTELRMWLHQGGNKPPTPVLEGVWERRSVHAKKLALIYHGALGSEAGTEISADTMRRAILALHRLVIPSHRVVLERVGASELQRDATRFDQLLARERTVLWADLPVLLGVTKQRAIEVVAARADQIHWERWKQLPKNTPGRARLVIVQGNNVIRDDGTDSRARPDEYQVEARSKPPRAILAAVDEVGEVPGSLIG